MTDSCHEVTGDNLRDVYTYFTNVEVFCHLDVPGTADGDAGGHAPGDSWWGAYVWNNFDYGWVPTVLSRRTLDRGIVETAWEFDDFQAHLNESARFGAELLEKEKEEKAQAEKRSPEQKRQESVEIITYRQQARRPDQRYQASDIISSGVTQSWTFTNSEPVSVSTSVEVSAGFFGLFEASASISVGYDYTVSIAKGESFTSGDCPGDAIVYWYPLYDHYWVRDQDGQTIDIFISLEKGDGDARGEYETDCLGSGTVL